MRHGTGASVKARRARRLGAALGALVMLSLLPGIAGHASPPWTAGYQRPATNEEYALLVLANRARVEHKASTKPMIWSDALALAARYHSWDRIVHDCNGHDSCDGTFWSTRIQRFYGSGSYFGENIGHPPTAQMGHDGWMSSAAHRANILNPEFTEFGASMIQDDSDIRIPYGTEDFARGAAKPIPALVAAAVLVPQNFYANPARWELALNYYDAKGRAPQEVRALVDGVPVALSRVAGNKGNGTWNAFVNTAPYPASFCKKVVFELRDATGETSRWPKTGAIGLGYGACYDTWQSDGGATPPPPPPPPPADGAPVVTITSPAPGAQVAKAVTVRATAVDDSKVKHIELWIDGKRKVRKANGTLVRQWNAGAKAVKPGVHTITVKAIDDKGNVGTATITVTK